MLGMLGYKAAVAATTVLSAVSSGTGTDATDTAEDTLTKAEKICNWAAKPEVKATLIVAGLVVVAIAVLAIVYRVLKKTGVLR